MSARSIILTVFAAVVNGFKFLIYLGSIFIPRNDRIWIFTAGSGDRFAENTKYLFLKCESDESIRNVWLTTNSEVHQQLTDAGYEVYHADSWAGRLLALRAGVFFRSHEPILPEYSGRATLVQLSHGIYLKTIGYDNGNQRYDSVLEKLAGEWLINRRTHYAVTSMGPPADLVESAFRIPRSRMLPTGFPRNDVLLRPIADSTLGIDTDSLDTVSAIHETHTTIFYTPTWREAYGETNGIPLEELDLGFPAIDSLLGQHDAHLFVSVHPESTFDQDIDSMENISILDTGGDIYPFLSKCDVLVTDYSGIFYDFLLLDRPIVFYAPDLQAYEQSRGLYFEYESHVPGPVAKSATEFERTLEAVLSGQDAHATDRASIRSSFFDDPDGSASDRVIRSMTFTRAGAYL